MIGLTIEGRDKVLQRYLSAGPRVKQAVNREVVEVTQEVAEHVRAKIATYSRSGRLLESIRTMVNYFAPGTIQGRVFADLSIAPYAAIQERGGRTKPHIIVPRNASTLAFMGRDGEHVFAGLVRHPGAQIPAKNFMTATMSEDRAFIIARLRGAARGAL